MQAVLKRQNESAELDEISSKLARSARDKAKASELDYKIKAYDKISKTKDIPVISKIGKKAAEPDIKMADRRKRQANLANRKLGGMGDYEYDDKGKYRRQGPAKVLAKEEVELDEAGSSDRLAIIKQAAQRVKERQAVADKKAAAAAKRDMKAKGAQRGMAPLKKDLDEKSRSFPFQGSNDHAPKNIFQPPFGSRKTWVR